MKLIALVTSISAVTAKLSSKQLAAIIKKH